MNRLQQIEKSYGHGVRKMIAEACGVSAMTSGRWFARGYLPLSDLIGKTRYAAAIEQATEGLVTEAQLHEDIRVMAGLQSTAA